MIQKQKNILFTIPQNIDGKLYDFHYNFGMRPEYIIEKQRIVDNWHFFDFPLKPSKKTNKNRKSNNNTKKSNNAHHIAELNDSNSFTPDQTYIDMNVQLIFFHKTTQNITLPVKDKNNNTKSIGNSEHTNCYFKQYTKIDNTNNIICIDAESRIMKTSNFNVEELNQINEIISRPFIKHGGIKNFIKRNFTNKRKYKQTKMSYKRMQ